jgi:dTDP-4-amino-4,6-dideoxygalactose transaminase
MNRIISFSPPDITQREIDEVTDTLRSGWITTGPKTKIFENEIATYCKSERCACVNSATAALELVLRIFGIKEGDEVITTPYTYAATANVILHVGAKPVFVDVAKDSFNIAPDKIFKAITKSTKAVIPVDFGGEPCDYDEIRNSCELKKKLYRPSGNSYQRSFDRIMILSDSAHSFGASYNGRKIGVDADFNVFSFHAVKNLTTAEGGAVTFGSLKNHSSQEIYDLLMLYSLHGQNKDALAKTKTGGWKYSIMLPGYKCNMTDIFASLGLVQLSRYDTEIIPSRKIIYDIYDGEFAGDDRFITPPFNVKGKTGSYHLYPLRIKNIGDDKRSTIISSMSDHGISCNVHFIPLPLHPVYEKLGYKMKDYPNAYSMYENEISLPVHSKMILDDAKYVVDTLKEILTNG